MCGIAGILNIDGKPADAELVWAMAESLKHRGPDDEGVYTNGPLALGHRRLEVLDLTPASHQPMVTQDNRYSLIYNGELYNYREIRKELEKKGIQFHSTGDTEVILNALIHMGVDAIEQFNGMFAFAFWDAKKRALLLARDRFGTKPLYYTRIANSLIFASEIKAFLHNPEFSVMVNKEVLFEYFTFQNIFSDQSLFNGVQLLPAGTYLQVDQKSQHSPKPSRYWDFHFEEPSTYRSQQDYIEELDYLLRKSVQRQLVSDVHVGGYLSGGMDTGSIIALATGQAGRMNTFTIGFDMNAASGLEINFDEREEARFLSKYYGTEHHERTLQAGDMEQAIPSIVWHLDEPRVGQCYPNYYASLLASKSNKVVLSGTGGDELFGGYPWRYYRASENDDFEHFIEHYYAYWQRLIPDSDIHKIFAPIFSHVKDIDTRHIFSSVFDSHRERLSGKEDYINHSFYFEAKTFLHGLLLVDDKLSMANGLEARYPFLDNDLVEFAMKLPVSMKLSNLDDAVFMDENQVGPKIKSYFNKTGDGKLILREAMKRYVPENITNQPKQGFSGPDASWFRGKSINYVRRKLIKNDAAIYNFMDRKTVHTLINDHLDGRANRRLLIWSLLCFEEWCHAYLD